MEAVVVNQEILDRFKEGPEREPALFGLIVALADVNQSRGPRNAASSICAISRTDRTRRPSGIC